jgi:hypothetical protein
VLAILSLADGMTIQAVATVLKVSEELFMSQMRRPETMKMEFANG